MTSTSVRTTARVLLVAVATVAALTGCSTDRFVDLNTLYAEGEPWELATNAHDTTDQLCGDLQSECLQGLSTDHAHYRKFDSPDAAQTWKQKVQATTEVRRTDVIVLQFLDPALSENDKNEILHGVARAHDSDT